MPSVPASILQDGCVRVESWLNKFTGNILRELQSIDSAGRQENVKVIKKYLDLLKKGETELEPQENSEIDLNVIIYPPARNLHEITLWLETALNLLDEMDVKNDLLEELMVSSARIMRVLMTE